MYVIQTKSFQILRYNYGRVLFVLVLAIGWLIAWVTGQITIAGYFAAICGGTSGAMAISLIVEDNLLERFFRPAIYVRGNLTYFPSYLDQIEDANDEIGR